MKTNVYLWQYLTEFLLEWEMVHTKIVEKIKTHILRSVNLSENPAVYAIMYRNILQSRTGHRWQNNTAHAYCRLDTKGYEHTLRICNTSFPLQHWWYECASMLRHTYAACLVRLPTTTTSLCFRNRRMTPCQQMSPHRDTEFCIGQVRLFAKYFFSNKS
jgi:hypothetical protein